VQKHGFLRKTWIEGGETRAAAKSFRKRIAALVLSPGRPEASFSIARQGRILGHPKAGKTRTEGSARLKLSSRETTDQVSFFGSRAAALKEARRDASLRGALDNRCRRNAQDDFATPARSERASRVV